MSDHDALVIYHDNCPDGFTAAWLMNRWLLSRGQKPMLFGASYMEPPPIPHAEGVQVYCVDFCYPPKDLHALSEAGHGLVVLDHHEKARDWAAAYAGYMLVEDIDAAGDRLRQSDLIIIDQMRSGAGLAAQYTAVDGLYPFVAHVEKYDLWLRDDDVDAVCAIVHGTEKTLENWDALSQRTEHDLISSGRPVVTFRRELIAACVAEAYQTTVLGHDNIWVAACPYMVGSEVAGRLAIRDPDRFAGYYVDKPNGRRRWGLRSTEEGMNVNHVASAVGGGGHAHAAGFELDRDMISAPLPGELEP